MTIPLLFLYKYRNSNIPIYSYMFTHNNRNKKFCKIVYKTKLIYFLFVFSVNDTNW